MDKVPKVHEGATPIAELRMPEGGEKGLDEACPGHIREGATREYALQSLLMELQGVADSLMQVMAKVPYSSIEGIHPFLVFLQLSPEGLQAVVDGSRGRVCPYFAPIRCIAQIFTFESKLLAVIHYV